MKDWRTSTTVAIDLMVYSILNVVGLLGNSRRVGVKVGVSPLCSVSTGRKKSGFDHIRVVQAGETGLNGVMAPNVIGRLCMI